jgi:hypothetical protein
VSFWWAKGLNVNHIHKETFLVYGGKCSSRKAVHKWVEKFSKNNWYSKMMPTRYGIGWDSSQKLLRCGFRRTGKAMRQMYQCWWRIYREIKVFPDSNITCFTFYIHLRPIYWLSLVILFTVICKFIQVQCFILHSWYRTPSNAGLLINLKYSTNSYKKHRCMEIVTCR